MQLPQVPPFYGASPHSWLALARISAPHAHRRKSGGGSRLPTVALRSTAARLCRHRQPKSALAALHQGRKTTECLLVGTDPIDGVDPQAYLKAVIERLPGARPDELDELLPSNWAAAHRAAHPAIKSEREVA